MGRSNDIRAPAPVTSLVCPLNDSKSFIVRISRSWEGKRPPVRKTIADKHKRTEFRQAEGPLNARKRITEDIQCTTDTGANIYYCQCTLISWSLDALASQLPLLFHASACTVFLWPYLRGGMMAREGRKGMNQSNDGRA